MSDQSIDKTTSFELSHGLIMGAIAQSAYSHARVVIGIQFLAFLLVGFFGAQMGAAKALAVLTMAPFLAAFGLLAWGFILTAGWKNHFDRWSVLEKSAYKRLLVEFQEWQRRPQP